MLKRVAIVIGVVLFASIAYAADGPDNDMNGTITTVRNGMIAICLAIAFVTVAIRANLDGGEIRVSQVVFRMFMVVLALMAAGRIQGFIGGLGQSLADNLLPGSSIEQLQETLQQRVQTMQAQNGNFKEDLSITDVSGILNRVVYYVMMALESGALTIYFLIFKWFQVMHHVVMSFLAAIAPFMITASIIPGINGFGNWVKLVISVSLWPAIASFFLKSHLMSATTYLGTVGQDLSSYTSMDALQLLSEALLFAFFMLATPFLSSAIVSGSASAFSVGSAFLFGGAGPLSVLSRPGLAAYSEGRNLSGGAVKTKVSEATVLKQSTHTRTPQVMTQAVSGSSSASAKYRAAMPQVFEGGQA